MYLYSANLIQVGRLCNKYLFARIANIFSFSIAQDTVVDGLISIQYFLIQNVKQLLYYSHKQTVEQSFDCKQSIRKKNITYFPSGRLQGIFAGDHLNITE